jgi:hypothetical protein
MTRVIALLLVGASFTTLTLVPVDAVADSRREITCDRAKRSVTVRVPGRVKFKERGLVTLAENNRIWVAASAVVDGDPNEYSDYYACWNRTGRGTHFAAGGGGAAVTNFEATSFSISGRYFAFEHVATGDENHIEFISVDVKTGRKLRSSGRLPQKSRVTECRPLRVTSSGAIAWLTPAGLYATDSTGTKQLASTEGGQISLLYALGSKVVWRQNGETHSARLR